MPCCDNPWPFCRLDMFPNSDQTIASPPAAPALEFATTTNDYPDMFDVQSGVAGVPLSVAVLEDALVHVLVYLHVNSHPTNGFDLGIVGGENGQDENFNMYVDPRSAEYVFLSLVLRSGPDGDNLYPFVRQKAGNSSFSVDAAATWMEVHRLGPVTNP